MKNRSKPFKGGHMTRRAALPGNDASAMDGHPGIHRSLDYIFRYFRDPITPSDLARLCGMSRRGFYMAFQKKVGASPGAILRGCRIEYAKQLLIEDDLLLTQIAGQCGFRSVNSFCVAFQRAVKISPKRYQRRCWLAVCRELKKDAGHASQSASAITFPASLGGKSIPGIASPPSRSNRRKQKDVIARQPR